MCKSISTVFENKIRLWNPRKINRFASESGDLRNIRTEMLGEREEKQNKVKADVPWFTAGNSALEYLSGNAFVSKLHMALVIQPLFFQCKYRDWQLGKNICSYYVRRRKQKFIFIRWACFDKLATYFFFLSLRKIFEEKMDIRSSWVLCTFHFLDREGTSCVRAAEYGLTQAMHRNHRNAFFSVSIQWTILSNFLILYLIKRNLFRHSSSFQILLISLHSSLISHITR